MQLPGSCRDLAAAHQRNLQHLYLQSRGRAGAFVLRRLICRRTTRPLLQVETREAASNLLAQYIFAWVCHFFFLTGHQQVCCTLAHLSAGDGRSRHKLRGVLQVRQAPAGPRRVRAPRAGERRPWLLQSLLLRLSRLLRVLLQVLLAAHYIGDPALRHLQLLPLPHVLLPWGGRRRLLPGQVWDQAASLRCKAGQEGWIMGH